MKKEVFFPEFFDELLERIDISPSQYKTALSHYDAVAKCLADGKAGEDIYVQGSFALGTVIRPFKGGKDADFDLDIVCQGVESRDDIAPELVKLRVKRLILMSPHHSELLSRDEGRRCWTLHYSPSDDGIGFHLDILPCLHECADLIQRITQKGINPMYADHAIAITDKDKKGTYGWSSGNARGYAQWFHDINDPFLRTGSIKQKWAMVEKGFFAAVEDVPDLLLRSPLQRVIQLLKRHRDCRFDGQPNENDKPISIIITTLVARIAEQAISYDITLIELLGFVIQRLINHVSLLDEDFEYNAALMLGKLIDRTTNGWSIENPVDPFENFAERWAENNHAKARAFFQWLDWVKEDFDFDGKDSGAIFRRLQKGFGEDIVARIYSSLELNPIAMPAVFIAPPKGSAPKPYRR